MAEPANTLILDLVAARLANITTANGYYYTAKKVERARLTPFKGYDLPSINYWPTGLSSEIDEYRVDKRTMNLYIEIHNETRDDPFTTIADRMAADVVTALNRTTAAPKVSDDANINLNGAVESLNYLGHDYEIGQGQAPFCGAIVKIEIVYNTAINNMFTYSA